MSYGNTQTTMNKQIYEEATDWLIRQRDGGLDELSKPVFDRWLRASPEHVRAYMEMSSVWEDMSSLNPAWNADADELIASARQKDNVVPLAARPIPPAYADRNIVRRPLRMTRIRAIAASIAVLCVTAVLGAWLNSLRGSSYETGVGEHRSIVLADGSKIELNARSNVRVRFDEHERAIDLTAGQALFEVAKDPQRPFTVYSGSARIRAVGTQFDVYRKASGTIVTVVEGRVAVSEARRRELSSLLSAGEQVIVTPKTAIRPKRADVVVATSWTQGRLVFDVSPLTEVAEEFNRYNSRRLIVEDPALATFHVSGVFSSTDPDLLLRFLRKQPEITVLETGNEIRISKK